MLGLALEVLNPCSRALGCVIHTPSDINPKEQQGAGKCKESFWADALSNPSTYSSPSKNAQGLQSIVDPKRQATRFDGCDFRGQAGLAGLQDIEPTKKEKQEEF